MKTTFICLANSIKLNGRCVAGIEILNGNPIIVENKPKWIRPVSNTEHGEVPTDTVSHIKLLDIVEIETTKEVPDGFQSENILFKPSSIKVINSFPIKKLPILCDTTGELIFGNRGKAVPAEGIGSLTSSLIMICTDAFELFDNSGQNKSKIRIRFEYNSNRYDLPVTDPVFLDNYKSNKNLISERKEIYLVLSLAIIHNGWHSKLVAGIL